MIYQGAKPVYQQLGKIKLIMYQKNVASVDNDTQIDDKTEYTQNHNVTYI